MGGKGKIHRRTVPLAGTESENFETVIELRTKGEY